MYDERGKKMDVTERIRTILLLEEMGKNIKMSKCLGLVDNSMFRDENKQGNNKSNYLDYGCKELH